MSKAETVTQDLLKAEPPHMWDYWRDKKGFEEALTDYYPRTLAENPQLQAALAQLRNAELAIDAIMTLRANDTPDDEN